MSNSLAIPDGFFHSVLSFLKKTTMVAIVLSVIPLPAVADVIVFKDNVVLHDAKVVARKGKNISIRWQNENYMIDQKNFIKVIEQQELDNNPGLKESYTHSADNRLPANFAELRKMLGEGGEPAVASRQAVRAPSAVPARSLLTDSEACQAWVPSAANVAGRFGIFGDFGYSSYDMRDINMAIHGFRRVPSGASASMDDIVGGLTFGGGLQYGINRYFLVGAAAEYLDAGSIGTVTNGSDKATQEYHLPLLAVGAFAKGVIPVSDSFLFTAGLGLDYMSASGEVKYSSSDGYSSSDKLSGTGVGVQILAGAQYFFGSNFSLSGELGYRIAKITTVYDKDGKIWKAGPDDNMYLDYSGVIVRLGANVYFGNPAERPETATVPTARTRTMAPQPQYEQVPSSGSALVSAPAASAYQAPQAAQPRLQHAPAAEDRNDKKTLSYKLRELKALLDDGILTMEDYNEQKKKLLERYSRSAE